MDFKNLTCLFRREDFNDFIKHEFYQLHQVHRKYVVVISNKFRNKLMKMYNGNIFQKQLAIFHQNIPGKKNPKDIITNIEALLNKLVPDIMIIYVAPRGPALLHSPGRMAPCFEPFRM